MYEFALNFVTIDALNNNYTYKPSNIRQAFLSHTNEELHSSGIKMLTLKQSAYN